MLCTRLLLMLRDAHEFPAGGVLAGPVTARDQRNTQLLVETEGVQQRVAPSLGHVQAAVVGLVRLHLTMPLQTRGRA